MSVWYYCKNGTQHGPITVAEIEAMVDRGELFDTTRVWKSGMPEWTKLSKLPDLSAKFEVPPSIPESERSRFSRLKSLLTGTIQSVRETAGKS